MVQWLRHQLMGWKVLGSQLCTSSTPEQVVKGPMGSCKSTTPSSFSLTSNLIISVQPLWASNLYEFHTLLSFKPFWVSNPSEFQTLLSFKPFWVSNPSEFQTLMSFKPLRVFNLYGPQTFMRFKPLWVSNPYEFQTLVSFKPLRVFNLYGPQTFMSYKCSWLSNSYWLPSALLNKGKRDQWPLFSHPSSTMSAPTCYIQT